MYVASLHNPASVGQDEVNILIVTRTKRELNRILSDERYAFPYIQMHDETGFYDSVSPSDDVGGAFLFCRGIHSSFNHVKISML